MRRSWFWMLCAAGALVAGCTDYGSYHVSWQFVGGEGARAGCGLHGVDSIRMVGTNTEGERDDFTALCAREELVHSVPVGTWTFSVHQVDVRGGPADMFDDSGAPVAPMAVAVITDGATVPLDPEIIELTPRPACQDRVDNDRDGRVDLDDSACAGDANGASE